MKDLELVPWHCVLCGEEFGDDKDAALAHVVANPEGHDVSRIPEEV
jgi:hypothetical protein